MSENLRLARLYFLLLAVVTLGRWVMSFQNVPYEKGTDKLSIVILTVYSAIFYGAFCRRWKGFRLGRAVVVGMTLGLVAQLVIFLSTFLSYAFGLETYFNYPRALNSPVVVPMATALLTRLGGLVVNVILSGIAGALGWAIGALLPETR
jgi:hypothetical protein